MPQFLVWVHGLGAALIGGASTAITLSVVDPVHFNFSTGFAPLWHSALVSGLLAAAGYLKQSPLPPASDPKSSGSAIKAILFFALLSFSFSSCNTVQKKSDGSLQVNAAGVRSDVQAAVPYIRPAAAAAAAGVITFGVNPADRAAIANDVFAVASVVDSLAGGIAPTPDALQSAIAVGTGKADQYVMIGQALESVYTAVYPQIKGDPALAVQVLGQLAAGARDAARAFTTQPAAAPSPAPAPAPTP